MKQVRINTLLDIPPDNITFQREWTVRGQHGKRAILLEIAFFAGAVGPGLYMISCFQRFYFGLLVGLLIVLVGYGLPHMLFLGRIERFWRGILKPQSSWISKGFVIANLFLLFAFLSNVHHFAAIGGSPLSLDSSVFGTIMLIGFISALLLALYPGFLLSILRAIPFWNSILLIPLFLAQALGGGIALTFVLAQVPGVSGPRLEPLLVAEIPILGFTAALITLHLYARSRSGASGKISVQRLVRGKYRVLFLFGAMFCGLIMPLLLILLALLGLGITILTIAAGLFQLTGILLFKYCLLNVGAYNQLYSDHLLQTQSVFPPKNSIRH